MSETSPPGNAGGRRAESIALCAAGELYGGVERQIVALLDGLAANGMRPALFLFHDGELATLARKRSVEPCNLPARNASIVAASRRLAAIVAARGIRVVHAHGYKATVCCALANAWHRFAIVKTEHGLPEEPASSLAAVKDRLYHWLDLQALRATHASVCYVTEDLRARCIRHHRGLRASVIPNGVDAVERSTLPRPSEYRSEWFNVALVGRLDAVKGHRYAIDALASAALPARTHLHIVGAGPSEAALRAQASASPAANRIHFAGFRPDAGACIAHCDTLLIPSLHEGMPFVLLEAMAFGVPIVASRVGGLAEVLADEVSALLVPPREPAAIACAVRRLHDDVDLRDRLRRQARACHASRYSLAAMTSSYLRAYRDAVGPS